MYASGRRICTFLEGAQRGGRGIIAWRRALEKRDVRAEVEAMRRLLIVAQVEEGLGAVDVTRRTSCGLFFRAGAWSRRELPNAVILRHSLPSPLVHVAFHLQLSHGPYKIKVNASVERIPLVMAGLQRPNIRQT